MRVGFPQFSVASVSTNEIAKFIEHDKKIIIREHHFEHRCVCSLQASGIENQLMLTFMKMVNLFLGAIVLNVSCKFCFWFVTLRKKKLNSSSHGIKTHNLTHFHISYSHWLEQESRNCFQLNYFIQLKFGVFVGRISEKIRSWVHHITNSWCAVLMREHISARTRHWHKIRISCLHLYHHIKANW